MFLIIPLQNLYHSESTSYKKIDFQIQLLPRSLYELEIRMK